MPDEIARLREILAGATRGKWEYINGVLFLGSGDGAGSIVVDSREYEDDAKAIAALGTLRSALIDAVEDYARLRRCRGCEEGLKRARPDSNGRWHHYEPNPHVPGRLKWHSWCRSSDSLLALRAAIREHLDQEGKKE